MSGKSGINPLIRSFGRAGRSGAPVPIRALPRMKHLESRLGREMSDLLQGIQPFLWIHAWQ